jgi:hypothetical protein
VACSLAIRLGGRILGLDALQSGQAKDLGVVGWSVGVLHGAASRRQNVGSPADSEVSRAGAYHRGSPDAGKSLEAATGVEPVMEVLQSSVRSAHG